MKNSELDLNKSLNILIAPNALKHSLTATATAAAIQKGLMQSNLNCNCRCFPIGDGGDGTGFLLNTKFNGAWVNAAVQDPLGRMIHTSFGLIEDGKTAVIEMASASGLALLQPHELNPLKTTSFGAGELVKIAIDKGAEKIIIGMGGSATVDGGIGILKALGIRFLNAEFEDLIFIENMIDLAFIDISGIDKRIEECEVIVLCDVENKLLGRQGAAAVFGAQKGASELDIKVLDTALERVFEVLFSQTGKDISEIKYGGTAGGAAAGLYGLLNAKLVSGIDYFLQLTNFDSALDKCDMVITAEGGIDLQTLKGKGPFGVARQAKAKGLPVVVMAGSVPLEINSDLQKYFNVIMPIANQPFDMTTACAFTEENLVRTGNMLGNLLALDI